MKHHMENEILIGMEDSDVENNGGGEQVLEADNVRLSQRTWSETNVLAWACVHDEAMRDGGKLQAVLRGTRPHVAVVEHGPRCDKKVEKTSSALIDVGSKARFDKSVRGWARKEGYGCAYIVGEASEAMTVLSVLRPLRVNLWGECAREQANSRRKRRAAGIRGLDPRGCSCAEAENQHEMA